MQFAVAAVEQSEVYWNLITKIQPSKLTRLTQYVNTNPTVQSHVSD